MATSATTATLNEATHPIAPWWHTLIVLLPLAAGSILSWHRRTLSGGHIPGLSPRLSSYVFAIGQEWLLVLLIWVWLRRRGLRLSDLTEGHWRRPSELMRDAGIGAVFVIATMPALGLLMHLTVGRTHTNPLQFTPKTAPELCVWFVLCATAGFCEEIVFRGYLDRQFSGWSNSRTVGLIAQAVLFGLAHGYYHSAMVAIMFDGLFYGLLARWRKSLRAGMLAHGLQDALGGLLSYLS